MTTGASRQYSGTIHHHLGMEAPNALPNSPWFVGHTGTCPARGLRQRQPSHRTARPLQRPADDAMVSSLMSVTLGTEHFTVEPAGAVKPCAGHPHSMVEPPCLAAGSSIPKDAQHWHSGQAQMAAVGRLVAIGDSKIAHTQRIPGNASASVPATYDES